MMKKIHLLALLALLSIACKEQKAETRISEPNTELNQELAEELARMAEVDQIAAYIPQGEYAKLSQQEWDAFKDSVFTTHQIRLDEIFNQHGFPGYDLVGKEGSKNFWLMVQHADRNPDFQQKVLEKMKVEVERDNAEPSNYGLLVDRVNLNSGKAQVYGTQVTYNTKICQAYPKNLADSATVNERRKSVGLPPLEVYLNEMTQMHFEMNKETYLSQGIMAPKLYKTE